MGTGSARKQVNLPENCWKVIILYVFYKDKVRKTAEAKNGQRFVIYKKKDGKVIDNNFVWLLV